MIISQHCGGNWDGAYTFGLKQVSNEREDVKWIDTVWNCSYIAVPKQKWSSSSVGRAKD